jgi:fructosamine-3-kinase
VTLPAGASEVRSVGGGSINEAHHVRLKDRREAFVKSRQETIPGEYASEAAGLAWLAEPGHVRTPAVLEVDERYLALEWIEPGQLSESGVEELGRGLALTHAAGAEAFGVAAGPRATAGFGSLRLSNEPTPDWPSFYAERRLRPLAALAFDRGTIAHPGIEAVERICEQIGELAGPPEPPARLHGDLWSGNVMADSDGRPWLIDPSAYGGHREIDLAMLALFGGWAGTHPRIFDAYEECAPLAEGWRERVGLYQLMPLLVHALLFGGSYCGAAERMAMSYAR